MTPQPPTRPTTAPSSRNAVVPSSRQKSLPSSRQTVAPSSRHTVVPVSKQTSAPSSRQASTPSRQTNTISIRQKIAPSSRQTIVTSPRQSSAPSSQHHPNAPSSRQPAVSSKQLHYEADRLNMAANSNNDQEGEGSGRRSTAALLIESVNRTVLDNSELPVMPVCPVIPVLCQAVLHIPERLDNLKLDNRTTEQPSDLILRAMNETRNIERLSLSVGNDHSEDPALKMEVQKSAAVLNKSLKQLMTTTIADSLNMTILEAHTAQTDSRITMLKSLLDDHGIDSGLLFD
ncbi:uncharacterized protein LOC134821740 isoform X1 [Bolinopsis microptera]|uniref:uncharacterized protein LOC134821740 isoform X1 n=1 Tax=Bolinopsis microptera TaxID=2820187 RepID=UPI00307983F1